MPSGQVSYDFKSKASEADGTAAFAADEFKVISFEGFEELSQPFYFRIEVVSNTFDVDLNKVVGAAAEFTIARGSSARKLHGIVSSIEQGPEGASGSYHYLITLVPRLWKMGLSRQTHINQDITIPDLLKQELEGTSGRGPKDAAAIGLADGEDFQDKTDTSDPTPYPQREYVVQFNETDLDFIHRWMEDEGIFYYFEHTDQREKLILCDKKEDFPAVADTHGYPFRTGGMSSAGDEAVHSFTARRDQRPKSVSLVECKPTQPTAVSSSTEQVETDQTAAATAPEHGTLCEFGVNFSTDNAEFDPDPMVQRRAKVRAEEAGWHRHRFVGESDCTELAAGGALTLEEHFRFNGDYRMVRVAHWGWQVLPGIDAPQMLAAPSEADGDQGHGARVALDVDGPLLPRRWRHKVGRSAYANAFVCIPADVAFRPVRRTPKPTVRGVMTAVVQHTTRQEADQSHGNAKQRADIDPQGRYKLLMHFDQAADPDEQGSASCYVPLAHLYGSGHEDKSNPHGMHFPLLPGTQVLWTCINGDPDRPVIVGALQPLDAPSVVTRTNQTQSVIKTPSNITMTFEDGLPIEGREFDNISFKLDVPEPPGTGEPSTDGGEDGHYRPRTDLPPRPRAYMRLGAEDTTPGALEDHYSDHGNLTITGANGTGGFTGRFDYTSANYTNVVAGNYERLTHGESRERTLGNTHSFTSGTTLDLYLGVKMTALGGLDVNYLAGGKVDTSLSADVKLRAGYDIEYSAVGSYKRSKGWTLHTAKSMSTTASDSITLQVDPSQQALGKAWDAVYAGVGGGMGIAIALGFHEMFDDVQNLEGWKQAALLASGVGYGAAIAGAVTDWGKTKLTHAADLTPKVQIDKKSIHLSINPACHIKMDASRILLRCGLAQIMIKATGEIQVAGTKTSVHGDGQTTVTSNGKLGVSATAVSVAGRATTDVGAPSSMTTCKGLPGSGFK